MPSYDLDTKLTVKQLFVQEQRSPDFIAKLLKDRPSANTIKSWADKKADGKTWWDERKEFEKDEYENISPKRLTQKILKRVSDLLDKPDFSSDALAKELSALKKISDPENQIHVMYQMLTDFMVFIREQRPQLLNEELTDVFRDFRTHIRKTLDA